MARRERELNPLAYAARSQPTSTYVHVGYNAALDVYGKRYFIFQPRYGTTESAIKVVNKCALGDDVCSFDQQLSTFRVNVHSAKQAERKDACYPA